MDQIVQYGLLPYIVLFFLLGVIKRKQIVEKKIGSSPISKATNGLYYLLHQFRVVGIIAVSFYALYTFFYGNPIAFSFINDSIKIVGCFAMFLSLLITIVAQRQMGSSWRIGVNFYEKNNLISHGLFKYSRNPIYLGILVGFIGLFLSSPNCLTIGFLSWAYILIQIEIRLEEAFLLKSFGQKYEEYYKNTPRYLLLGKRKVNSQYFYGKKKEKY